MATFTAEARIELTSVYIAMFDAAPGVSDLNYMANLYREDNTVVEIAAMLAERDSFEGRYPPLMTNQEFAEKFVDQVVEGSVPEAQKTWAENWAVSKLQGGWSRAEVIVTAMTALREKPDLPVEWAEGRAKHSNQTEVGVYYATQGLDGDLSARQAAIAAVTAEASTVTVAKTAIDNNEVDIPGTSFTLTTGVDAIVGTTGNDTLSAIQSTSGTFSTGDTIDGKAGTDVLNLTMDGGSATVDLEGVETINARTLQNSTLNAVLFDGVQTISNKASVPDTTLTVSNASLSTQYNVVANADLDVNFLDSSGKADAVTVSVATGAASNRTSIDVTGVETANIMAAGSSFISLEAGSSLDNVVVTGDGALNMNSDDALDVLDASATTGKNTYTLSGTSSVTATGGTGDETFAFGSTLATTDTIDGGAGTDSLTFSMGAGFVAPTVTNVESATATLTGSGTSGTLSLRDATFAALTVNATGTASDLDINDAKTGLSVDLNDNDLDDVNIDTAAGATLSVSIGNASSAVGLNTFVVSDAATVNISSDGEGGNTMNAVTLDATDTKTVNISAAAEGSLTQTGAFASDDVETVSISSAKDAAISLGATATFLNTADKLESLTITASGDDDGDVTITNLGNGTAAANLNNVSITASDEADVTFGELDAAAADVASISITAGDDSVITDGVITANTVGQLKVSGVGTITLDAAHVIGQISEVEATGVGSGGDFDLNLQASGTAGGSVIRLGSGTNDITLSQGADTVVMASGSGTDTLILNSTDAVDNVFTTVQNFKVGTGGDDITLDISGLSVNSTDLVSVGDASTIANAEAAVMGTITGATDLDSIADTANILVIDGNITSLSNLETALEAGGSFALTADQAYAAGDAFLVLYDDGSNSYLAVVETTAGAADGANFVASDLVAESAITFSGVTDATDITAANFNAFIS